MRPKKGETHLAIRHFLKNHDYNVFFMTYQRCRIDFVIDVRVNRYDRMLSFVWRRYGIGCRGYVQEPAMTLFFILHYFFLKMTIDIVRWSFFCEI